MGDYEVPIIPKLNFRKNEHNQYIFESVRISLISKEDSKNCIAKNAKIIISNSINITFEIDQLDYYSLFMDEELSEDKRKIFKSINQQKYFDISCSSGGYHINLLNFHASNVVDESKKEFRKITVSGECEKGILIKNNNRITDYESVRIWDVLECSNISQTKIQEFNSNNLKEIYLKSSNTIDYYNKYETENDIKKHNNLKNKQNKSFNQLFDNNPFLFYESNYNDTDDKFIKNIDKLLMFFNSNIIPSRMRIIESSDSKKLEVRITSKVTYKLNGNSIFKEHWPNNLFDFLNSSYDGYIDAKNNEIDIDLLLHYYVWIKNEQYIEVKLILCSAFLEVLKNNRFSESRKNQRGKFHKKLMDRLELLELDSIKLLKFFFPDINDIISRIEAKYLNLYDKNDVVLICDDFRKYYIVYCLTMYRNKIIHSGRFNITSDDFKEGLIDKMIKNLTKSYSKDSQKELIGNIGNDFKINIKEIKSIFNIFKQTRIFEKIVEIVLLKFLNVDCLLSQNYNTNQLSEFNINDFSSKEYVNLFIKD